MFAFILRRARQHWQLLLTLSLGVVLAIALLASGPLLVDSVIETGLQLTLQSASAVDGNLRLDTSAGVDQAAFRKLDQNINNLLATTLDSHPENVIGSAESPWMYPWTGGRLETDQQVGLFYYEDVQAHLDYLAGGWPAEASRDPYVLRAVVSETLARRFALRVGDRLPLSVEKTAEEPDSWIEVTGIVRPGDPRDPYWFGEFGPFGSNRTSGGPSQFKVIVPPDVFFPAVASLFPEQKVELAWHVLLPPQTFTATEIGPFQAQLSDLEMQLATFQPRLRLTTGLPDILSKFQAQLETIRLPIYILVAEVLLLVLYYVSMVAALSVRQMEREFATLHSRGTSGWQITRIHLLEALIIVSVALVSGPWLGAGLVRGLSWAGPLADLGQAGWRVDQSRSAWVAAGAGALVCLAGLLLPLRPALRRSIVTHQQTVTRDTRPPWWQRLYLDVFALVVGLALLWRLRLYGAMLTGAPGSAHIDWLLLLAPLILLLGTATILLRVFPLLLSILAHLASRGRGLVGALALWQSARDPTHVTRLVLLLTLAVALGVLSTGINLTLDLSEYDRAYYLVGKDLRLSSQGAIPLLDMQSTPGVNQISGVWRGEGTLPGEPGQTQPAFEVLAVEPGSFSDVAFFRDDFADENMAGLLGQLAVKEGEHPALLLLPGHPARFGLWLLGTPEDKAELDSYKRWIDGDNDAERVGVTAKLQTAQGELFTIYLQRQGMLHTDSFTLKMDLDGRDFDLRIHIRPDNGGWYYFDGPLPELPPSSYPLSLHSLWFQNQATWLGEPIPKVILLVADDFTVVDGVTRELQVVEDFESSDRTVFMTTMQTGSRFYGLFASVNDRIAHSGHWGQNVTLRYTLPNQTFPLRLRQTWSLEPLPALASDAFLDATKLKVGDVVQASVAATEIDFRIVGAVHYFPTMYEQPDAGYLITSRDLILPLLNDTAELPINPNEAFVVTDGNVSLDNLVAMLPVPSQSWSAEGIRKTFKANPLALGLRSVAFFGFSLTILLSLLGFSTHFYLSIRQRETLYGVMRALGTSARQLYGWIVLEQAVLILAGLVLGTVLGMLLNQVTLPRLPVSLGDGQTVPPFVPHTDWLAIGQLYLGLSAAFLVVIALVTALLWRARLHRVLRIGQE